MSNIESPPRGNEPDDGSDAIDESDDGVESAPGDIGEGPGGSKFDHSAHPTTRPPPSDMRAPGARTTERLKPEE